MKEQNITHTEDVNFSHLNSGRKYDGRKTKRNVKRFGKFIYNRKDHTVCQRSFKNWIILIVFYLTFLAIILVLFIGLLSLILHILMNHKSGPLFAKTDLVNDPSPALNVYPRRATDTALLIWYTRKDDNNMHMIQFKEYIKQINDLLKPYNKRESKRYVDCEKVPIREGQYCLFSKSDLGPCGNASNDYGYRDDSPCVFLKLNMVEDWKPSRKRKKMYQTKNKDEDNLLGEFNESKQIDMIRVHCGGLNPFDEEHMGKVSYYPWNGFKDYFFPYDASEDYLRPIVGVQFKNITRGLIIGIKCAITDVENMKDPLQHSATFYFYIDKS